MNSIGNKRIASDMLKHIGDILANIAKDNLLKNVTITAVNVSKDLSFAKVYFTTLTEIKPQLIEKELNQASGFIRTKLAEIMNLRHTPELHFTYDSSIAYGQTIEKILEEIHSKDEK